MTEPTNTINTSPMVTLEEPIKRGETIIDTVSVRKPKAGELRGINLSDVLQMQVQTLITLLPRITDPVLTEAEVANMETEDIFKFGSAVSVFLLPKSVKF